MVSNINYKIIKNKKSYIIYFYNFKIKKIYFLELKNIFKNEILNYKYIILFLIKFGLVNVYI